MKKYEENKTQLNVNISIRTFLLLLTLVFIILKLGKIQK